MSGDHKRGVAILGRAGTGKTTLAEALVAAGVADGRESFAAALKEDIANLGVKKGQPHARGVMIAYGQNRRAINPDYWIERLRIDLRDDFDGAAIDDVRFPNEVAFLRERGFLVVKLTASGHVRLARGMELDLVVSDDPSEAGLDGAEAHLHLDTGILSVSECVALVADAMEPAA